MDGEVWAFARSSTGDVAEDFVHFKVAANRREVTSKDKAGHSLARHDIHPDILGAHLIHHPKQGDDISVLGLGDKLDENTLILHPPLRIRDTHGPHHEIDHPLLARMVIPVLRTREGVQIKVDPETVLPGPSERLEDVRPRHAFQEGFVVVFLNRPEWDGESDPVQPCGCDRCEILLGLKEGLGEERGGEMGGRTMKVL